MLSPVTIILPKLSLEDTVARVVSDPTHDLLHPDPDKHLYKLGDKKTLVIIKLADIFVVEEPQP